MIRTVLHKAERAWSGTTISVLVVDDASRDGTAAVVRGLAADDGRIRLLQRQSAQGLGAAFRAGLEQAQRDGVDALLHLDGDGQHDDADVAALLDPLQRGEADVILGSRFLTLGRGPEDLPPLARWGNQALAALVSFFAGQRLRDVSCGLRAFGPAALAAMRGMRVDYTYTHESVLVAAAAGLRIHEVAIEARGRRSHGRSRLVRGPIRHGVRATWGIARAHAALRREPRCGSDAGC